MKKGDIVQLRERYTLVNAAFWERGARIVRHVYPDAPSNLTVSWTGQERVCCTLYNVVQFEEIPGVTFVPGHFTVVLKAGEPDLTELLKEKEEDRIKQAEMQKVWAAMY